MTREAGVVEVVVPPRSSPGRRDRLPGHEAAERPGHHRGPADGQGPWATARPSSPRAMRSCCTARGRRSTQLTRDRDVLLVDSPEVVRRQAVPWGREGSIAVVILLRMVVLLATGAVPPAMAGLLAAMAMVLPRWSARRRPIGPSRGRPSYSSVPSSRSRPRSSPAGRPTGFAVLIDARRPGRPYCCCWRSSSSPPSSGRW